MCSLKSLCLAFFFVLIVCDTCGCQSSCVPISPSYSSPDEAEDIFYPTLPQFQDGIQAILPDYRFSCSGVVHDIRVQTIQSVSNSEFELQIWRPVGDRQFKLLWGVTYPTPVAFRRTRFDTIRWQSDIGVPVNAGDVLGFFIGKSDNPIRLFYSNSASAPSSTLFYVRNVDMPLCNISLCGDGVQSFTNMAPFINPTSFTMGSSTLAESVLGFSQVTMSCSTSRFSSCPTIQQTQVFNSMPETAPPFEVTPTPILTMSSSTTISVSPTPTPIPTSITTTSDISTTTENTESFTDETTNNPLSTAVVEDTNTTPSPPPGVVINVSPEAIVFIVIGILLLIILVVLVFVLIGCLRSKGEKVAQSSSLLGQPKRPADVESVDSRITLSTHLGASTSVEHSVSSNETGSVLASSSRSIPHRIASHHYTNGEITRQGVFSSFSPQYVNTRNHPLTHSTSQHQLRSERVLSTSALLGGQVNVHRPQLARIRAKSVEPSAKLCINSASNGIQPPPVPPRSHSRSHGANSHRYSVLEVSGDYDNPIPPDERHRVQSCAGWVGTRVHAKDSTAHEYADPDADPDNGGLFQSLKYDKLLPRDDSSHFDDHDSRVPGPQADGWNDRIDDHSYSDPDGYSKNDSLESQSNLIYTYVPTECQRRLMMINGGHYEIQEDFQQEPLLTYDRLKFFEERETYWAPATTESGLYTQLYENKYRELQRSQISVIKQIGSGHFGTVSMGVWLNGVDDEPVEVAIKTVKATTELERIKLLQEAAIMGQFAHFNVVRLLGVVTVGEPVLILLEYMTKGDLRSFLQKLHPRISKRELPEILPKLFIKFSKDIANGMSYLSKKNFVHRDLAARNILLTDDLTCKIGDFGMARDIQNDYYKSHGGIIPVKWTAPEALNYNKFSTASDVWSFGMVLFEIWSLGEKPFNELTNPIVIALVSSKHCQPPPPGCPRTIYHLMVECWNPVANKRPTFDSIYTYLDSPIESLTTWNPADTISDRRAHVLGAHLREANNLYIELQRTYQKPLIGLSQ